MLSDPLLDFVRQAMLSRPPPCQSEQPANGSLPQLGAASLAMAQRTQRAKRAQHAQQVQQAFTHEESLSPQPSTSLGPQPSGTLAGQASGTSTVSTTLRRSSAGSFAVDIRWGCSFLPAKLLVVCRVALGGGILHWQCT